MSARARLAIVGHRAELGTCLPPGPLPDLDVAWVARPPWADPDYIAGAVRRTGCDAVLVLEPDAGEGELLAGDGPVAAAWLVADATPEAGEGLDGFARVLAVSEDAAARAPDPASVRIEPLPVSDACFAPVRAAAVPPRVFFDGPTCSRRDSILQPVKHRFDVLHLAGGGSPERLQELLGRCDIALTLRDDRGVGLRDGLGTALASGLLVIAERPPRRPGLGAGVQLLAFSELWELEGLLEEFRRHPEAMQTLRARGRHYAERLRSSVALPRIAADLLAGA